MQYSEYLDSTRKRGRGQQQNQKDQEHRKSCETVMWNLTMPVTTLLIIEYPTEGD